MKWRFGLNIIIFFSLAPKQENEFNEMSKIVVLTMYKIVKSKNINRFLK